MFSWRNALLAGTAAKALYLAWSMLWREDDEEDPVPNSSLQLNVEEVIPGWGGK